MFRWARPRMGDAGSAIAGLPRIVDSSLTAQPATLPTSSLRSWIASRSVPACTISFSATLALLLEEALLAFATLSIWLTAILSCARLWLCSIEAAEISEYLHKHQALGEKSAQVKAAR